MKTKTSLLFAAMLLMVGAISCAKDSDIPTGKEFGYYDIGHGFVDLGLPSGTLWAICNIGADAPEDFGDYFAWGETAKKFNYHWSTYKYCNGADNTQTKYCSDADYGYNGYTDDLTTLQEGDDAATVNWGSAWRTPTLAQWKELKNNTTMTKATLNGVDGLKFTANNGNSLFLPAAGWRSSNGYHIIEDTHYYWSSSLYREIPRSAWCLYFYIYNDRPHSEVYGEHRDLGRPVRAVLSTTQK